MPCGSWFPVTVVAGFWLSTGSFASVSVTGPALIGVRCVRLIYLPPRGTTLTIGDVAMRSEC